MKTRSWAWLSRLLLAPTQRETPQAGRALFLCDEIAGPAAVYGGRAHTILEFSSGDRRLPLKFASIEGVDFMKDVEYEVVLPKEAPAMSTLTIRNLDPTLKEKLRVRAAEHGHSMEAEVRSILKATLQGYAHRPGPTLYERIRARVEPLGGIELELPPREPGREPPRFD